MGFLEHPPHAIAHTLREVLAVQPDGSAIAESLRPLGIATLVIAARAIAVSLGSCERLAAALPRAELLVVPGAGHVVNLEARDAVSAALRDFLQRLPPDPA